MARGMISPDAAAEKWLRNAGAAGQSIVAGVDAVTTAPGQAAAAQRHVWLANVTASADRWARNVAAVPLEQWKADMKEKGIPNAQRGISRARGKVAAFMQSWLPYQQQVVAQLPPRGDLRANIARMVALVEKNAEAKGRFRQGGR